VTGRRHRAAPLVAALAAGVLISACSNGSHASDPKPVHLEWQGASLPVPAGERALVRDATWCRDRWLVVGATADAHGDTKPAVWSSVDGAVWRPVELEPRRDFYAGSAILGSVGCREGRAAVLGAKSGGAHGNPRVATWRQRPDGSLVVVSAAFEQYGGPNAISVNRLVGGPAGYLIAGTRSSGAAVWSSRTGARFTLREGAPGLADTAAADTQALDAVWWRGSWTVVGDSIVAHGRLVATAWTGTGPGRWTPTRLSGDTGPTSGDRVVLTGAGPAVVGTFDDSFAVWTDRAGRWTRESTFGVRDANANSAAYVSGLAWTGFWLATTYSDGTTYRMAVGPAAGLEQVPLPATVAVEGDQAVTVAAHGPALLLLTDDAEQGRVWLTHVPAPAS
jgi:hypothetical protein